MTLLVILSALVAILLIGVVLIQNPKGGGLASNFSQGTQLFGVARTNDIVEKITWGLAVAVVILSLWSASYNKGRGDKAKSPQQEQTQPADDIPELPDLNK